MTSGSRNLRVDQFFRSRKAKCLSPSRGISKTVKEVKSPNTKGSLDDYLVKSADVCSSQLVQSTFNNRDSGEQQPNNKDKGPTISSNSLQLEDTCKSQSCSSHPQLSPGKETAKVNFGDHGKTLDQFADSFLAICCSGIASNDTTSLKEHEVNGSLKRNKRAESPDHILINKSRLKKKQCAIGGNNLLGRLTESINAPDETTQGRDQNTDTCCLSSSKLEYLQSGRLPSNNDGADVNAGDLPEEQSITYKDLLIFKNEELELKPHQESINNFRVGSESKLSNPPSFETPVLKKCSSIFGNQIDQNPIFTPKSDSVKRSACKDPKWVYRSSLSPGDDFWNEAIQVVDGLAAIKADNVPEHVFQREQGEIVQYQQRQLQSHMTTGEINTNFSTRERPGCNEMEAHALLVQHEGSSLPVKHFDFECEDRTMTNDASAVTTTKFLEGENENSEVKTKEVGEGDKVLTHIGATNISEVSSSKVYDSSNSKNEIGTPPSAFLLKDNLELINWLPERICDEYAKKGVTKLYPWQVECLQLDGVLEWKNLVYCASTSAGKSLVAEVLLLRRVLSAQKKALLVLPFVSLCAEKAEHLEKLLDPFNKRVRSFYGSQGGGTLPNDTSVAVCTIEKANSLVNRLLEEGRLGEVGIMVIDELHMVGDLSRGYLLELMLTKLQYATGEGASNASLNDSPESNRDRSRTNHGMQIVGMSATMPNVAAVADWLQAAFYETEFRPVPLDEYIKVGNLIHNKTLEVVRTIRKGANLGGKDPDHVVELCYEVVQGGHSVLVFCSSRKACEITAKHIAKFIKDLSYQSRHNDLSYNDALSAVDELRKSPSGLDPTLAETLPAGVAYHHAGLTVEEREIIEACYRQGIVRVLTATSTLAAGVNLPARRVIFRQPKIGRDFIDGTRYRQMSGRAGRAGIDTKGESIIICKPEEVKRITALLNESCPPLKSCLAEDKNGMKRAILEVVAGGIVQTASDVHRYVKCTLLNSTQPFEDVVKSAQDSLYWLCHAKFVEWDEQTQMYSATPLGRAAFGSSLSPEESMVVFEDLARAREGFVLASDLHLLYEVTPINIELEPDWELFYQRFMELSPLDQAVGNRVGVTEPFLMRMAHGAPGMQPHGKPRNRKSPLNKNGQSLLSLHGNNGLPMDQVARVCRRFYVALILARLVEEVPLNDVCEAFKVPRGMIQALQENAGRFASMVAAFCERLGWNDLEGLFSKFQNRVSFGVRAEIAELTSIPFVKGARARALYKAGLRTPQAVAEASLKELFQALFHSSSWAAQDGSRSETQFRIQMGVAKKIKNGARKIVLDQAEEARMAAFTAFRALGVNVPVTLSQPVNNIANESYDDVGENEVLSNENGSENNLVGQKTTSSSGLEMTVLANTSISHAKSTSKAEPGALTVQDQTRIQNVPETDKETTNTSVNKCAMNSSSLDAQRERGNHVINAASHGNSLTSDKKWAQNSAVETPIFSGSNINSEANHVSSKVNETDRVVTFNEGPVDVDNLSGGFDCFIDAWDKIPEFFFDLHYNTVTEKSSSYFEVHGLAVCWENSPVYYIKIAKCLSEKNSVSACNDTIVARSCIKSVEDIARERWSRITHLMNRKGSRKVTWDLKTQLQAFQKPILSQPAEILQNKIKNFQSMSSSSGGHGRSVSLPSIDIEEPIDACIIAWMLWPDEESTYGATLEQEVRKRLPGEIAAAANRSGRWLNQMGRVAQNGCCRRVAQIRALYFVLWKLIIAEGLQDVLLSVEMPLVRVLVDMEKWGIGLNMEACWQARKVLEKKLKELEDKAHMLAGVTFSLAMPADVANVLYGILQLPVPQGCKKGKQHPSTHKHALELLRHHHPIVMVIKEHRTLSNLLQCTVISVLSRARLSDGMQVHCVHGRWLQTSTATGRLSMEEPNLQRVEHSVDFTMKDEPGRSLDDVKLSEYQINAREIFIPTQKNWLLVSADYSQIELRLMAHFSEDESLISFLQKPDGDVFIMIAAKWTGQNESDITDKHREQTKKLVYGMLYGMGVNTLADNLECTVSEANEKYERFKCAFPGVSSWLQQAVDNCRQKGHIRTLSGRKRYLEKINFGNRLEQARAERQAVNSICQGSAADIIKKAMLNVHSVILGKCLEALDSSMFSGLKGNCHLLLQIHDELVLEVEPTMLKEATTLVRSCMENVVTLKVPLKVKIRVGGTWGSLQPYKDPE